VSGLSPTMRVRSGSTPSWSHAVRNTEAAGLQTPCSNDITTEFRYGDSPSWSIAERRSKPVSLTIPTGRPRSRTAFNVGSVSGNTSHDSALTVRPYSASLSPGASRSHPAAPYSATHTSR